MCDRRLPQRGGQSQVLYGLILRRIFDRNQQEFTSSDPKTIPTIAVVEEAQSVLNENAPSAEPYIAWVKEGRKYDLGAILITQQPGSIPVEILSQGDNWFVFHLLSASDLTSLKKANAHFSNDLLSSLLNEPIPGQGVFWSSVGGKPYPVSLRVLSFEKLFCMLDSNYNNPPANTYAQQLHDIFLNTRQLDKTTRVPVANGINISSQIGDDEPEPVDIKARFEQQAIEAFKNETVLIEKIESPEGVAWGTIKAFFLKHLPNTLDDREQLAYQLVYKGMNDLYGQQDQGWVSYKHTSNQKTYVRKKG